MRKILSIFAALIVVVMVLSSCTKTSNNLQNIPKTAFVVMTFEAGSYSKSVNSTFLKENEEFQEGMKNVEQISKKLKDLLDKVIDDPNESGIKFDKTMLAFAEMDKENIIGGCIVEINKSKLEENIKLIEEELDVPLETLEKDGITYYLPDEKTIIGWDKNKLMALFLVEGYEYNIEKRFFELMTLSKKESILQDKDFKSFLKDCKDFNLWISSNVVNSLPDASGLVFIESLLGFKLGDNYGHIHFDMQKDEWIFTAKLRFNESIQKADWNKVIKNIIDMGVLDEIFGKNYNFDDDYDYENYEMSDEEFEALINDLTEEK